MATDEPAVEQKTFRFVINQVAPEEKHCEIKQRLADAYSRELQNYSSATMLFAKNAGQPNSEVLNRAADLARVKAELARLRYEAHVAQHGC